MKKRDEPFALELGRRIRRVRIAAGLSQAALAERANLDPSTIGSLELGKREMQAGTAVLICVALRITPEEMFEGIDWVSDPDSPGGGSWQISSGTGTGPGAGADSQGECEAAR